MNSDRIAERVLMIAVTFMLAAGAICMPAAGTGWLYGTFEDNLQVSYEPSAPNNLDPVNVSLASKGNQVIGGANLYYNITPEGSSTPMPGGPFGGEFRYTGDQHISMSFTIPSSANSGGSRIDFYVVAWDTNNQRLTSVMHDYRPAKNGSFVSDSFSENVAVDHTPTAPKALEAVTVNVRSLNSGVRLLRVDVLVKYQSPGGNWSPEGSVNFEFADPLSGKAVIGAQASSSPNQPGFNVSFRVETFDLYYTKLSSISYTYGIPADENPDPQTMVALAIVVKDEALGKTVDGAKVRFENSSWGYETETLGGAAYTVPPFVHWGDYRIIVTYKGESQTRTVSTTRDGTRNVITFSFARATIINHPMQTFPQWFELIGIFAALVVCPLGTWLLYRKRRLQVEQLTEDGKSGKNEKDKGGLGAAFWKGFEEETKTPRLLIPVAFAALAALGTAFVPFYPWWMVALSSLVIGALAYRFPYLSLIFLSLLVTASAAYQTPEFGLFFLVFSTFVLICGFFDWRFGYFVFLSIFLARIGVPYFVPLMASMLVSSFIGVATAALAGLFMVFMATCGDQMVWGLLAGSSHDTSFMVFSTPVKDGFVPNDMGAVLSAIGKADTDAISTVFNSNFGASMVPFLVVACWCIAAYIVGMLVTGRTAPADSLGGWLKVPFRDRRGTVITAGAALLVVVPGTTGIFVQGLYTDGTVAALVGVAALGALLVALFAPGIALMARDLFADYYVARMGVSGVGTRISDMKALGKTTFDQVGGLTDVKQDMKEGLIVPLLRPDISDKFGIDPSKGILLFGPPGCGKTLMMKALATELNVEMINVKCSDIMSKWYGESEGKMAELFRIAKERKPCIIFFDEVDAIAKSRDLYSADDVTPRLLSIMLSEMDGMDNAAGLIFVGSTNKPELIDPALLRPGRFDKIIYVPPPDIEERKDVLRVHMKGKPVSGEVDYAALAKATERFSGADLANLVRETATSAMRRSIRTGKISSIEWKDFEEIMPKMKPSISPSMVEEYQRIKARYERKIHALSRTERRTVITFKDVGDLKEAKEFLREHVEIPLKRPDLVEKFKMAPRRALLLYGPPGCGKAYVVRAFSHESQLPLHVANGNELAAAVLTQGEEVLKELAQRVRDSAPAMLLVTDIEAFSTRPGMDDIQYRVLQTRFLSFIDTFASEEKMLVVGTTDRPLDIYQAFFRPGRFDRMLQVPLPDRNARKDILRALLTGVPTKGKFDVEWLLENSDGCNGEALANVVNEAKFLSITQHMVGMSVEELSTEKCSIEMKHLKEASSRILRPVPSDMVSSSTEFAAFWKRIEQPDEEPEPDIEELNTILSVDQLYEQRELAAKRCAEAFTSQAKTPPPVVEKPDEASEEKKEASSPEPEPNKVEEAQTKPVERASAEEPDEVAMEEAPAGEEKKEEEPAEVRKTEAEEQIAPAPEANEPEKEEPPAMPPAPEHAEAPRTEVPPATEDVKSAEKDEPEPEADREPEKKKSDKKRKGNAPPPAMDEDAILQDIRKVISNLRKDGE